MNLGKRIKDRRLELGLTLEEVGNMIGTTKSTVHKWETTHIENMRRDNIVLLAEALKVSPLWIMGIEEMEKEVAQTDTTSSLKQYFDSNLDKINKLSKDDAEKLIKLIDVYLD